MEPIAVAAALLREQLPDVTLRAGATVMARVASKHDQHAVLVLAGIPLTAEVPPEVENGATLRLKVHEVTPERVTLQLDPQQPVVVPQAAPRQAERARVTVEEPPQRRRGADGEPADVVALAFHSPALGRIDLRLELRGDRLLADVSTAAGPPLDAAQASSERLRANLTAAGLDPTVRVRPRREPLDVYA
jgi:Flagellar hook-length control protein FliK